MKDRCRKMIGIWLCVVGWTGFSAEGKAQEVITTAEDTIRIPANVAIKPWIGTDTVSMSHTPASFKPNPKKAVVYSAIFPGLGQIYNRKYWKLPLVYGGFMGFIYAVTWNNKNYRDYSEAYLHIVTDNPAKPDTWHSSWQNFVPAGRDPKDYISNANFRSNLKSGKDYYRRYRDLSIILTVAWYFLCIADSYVDAQLFDFDISSDLSLHLEPVVVPCTNYSPQLYGLNCSIKF